MKNQRWLPIIMLFCSCVAFSQVRIGQIVKENRYYKQDEKVFLRLAPSDNSTPIIGIEIGETVNVLDEKNEDYPHWYKVTYLGYTGYITRSNIEILRTDTPLSNSVLGYGFNKRRRCRVVGNDVIFRAQPSKSSKRVAYISDRPIIEVYDHYYGYDHDWYKVLYNGYIGWIARDYCKDILESEPLLHENTLDLMLSPEQQEKFKSQINDYQAF